MFIQRYELRFHLGIKQGLANLLKMQKAAQQKKAIPRLESLKMCYQPKIFFFSLGGGGGWTIKISF